MTNQLVHIVNRSGKVSLNEAVTKDSMDRLLEEIGGLFGNSMVGAELGPQNIVCQSDDAVDTLTLEINSPGGSVLEGVRLFHEIKNLRNRGVYVVAEIVGVAASMGSVIAMAADETNMSRGSRMMIHEASTHTSGDARVHLRQSTLLESISDEIAGFYADKTGSPKNAIREQMRNETWLDVDAAISQGFIDNIIGEESSPTTQTEQNMFNNRAELKAQVEALTTDVTDLENDLKAANDQIEAGKEVAEANAKLQSDIEALQTKEQELKAEIAELTKQKDEAEAKTTEEAITAKVTAEVAKAGIEPLDVVEDEEIKSESDKEFLDHWKSKTPTELFALKNSDPEAFARLVKLSN